MGLLAKLRGRPRDSNHHAEIESRLRDQERKAVRFERRLKRVEVELGIVRPGIIDDVEGAT